MYMKKIIFIDDDIKLLSKDPRVKYIDSYSIRFTLEFRQQLYDKAYPNFSISTVRATFKELNFNYIFNWKIYQSLSNNFKLRRPCSAANSELYKFKDTISIDKTYDSFLITTGKFKKNNGGISVSDELLEELNVVYPEISVKDYLKKIGLDVNRIGYNRIYRIQKELKEYTHRKITLSEEQISYLNNHPYIQKVNKAQFSFKDNFYQESQKFKHLNINDILKIFEIDPNWINYPRKANIKYHINSFIPKEVETLKTNPTLLIKIEKNKIGVLSKMVDDSFKYVKSNIAKYSCNQRKEICNMIKDISLIDGCFFTVRELLDKMGISKSSYYSILKKDDYGSYDARKNELDLIDKAKIEEVISSNKYPKGNRMIYMLLDKNGYHMSRSKINRLCKKFDIKCDVRKHNKSRQATRELLKRNCKENLVKRRFRLCKPKDIILTDVSYLKCGCGTIYLSAIKDACSGKVKLLVSEYNDLTLALNTLDHIPTVEDGNIRIAHSDQGFQYLTDSYQNKLKKLGYSQSMSKRGNCWDNAPQESFFGHMKDEIDFKLCKSFDEVSKEIEKYEYYYNYQRPQWTRNMMTPVEYEEYINSLSEIEYQEYYDKELKKYNVMMENAKIKAIKRGKDMGINSSI
jgi:putative transposase